MEDHAFWGCSLLRQFDIPASVTTIEPLALPVGGTISIAVEEGSVSFRVVNQLVVGFDVRSLLCVIGFPESIVIPSSIEELRESCCAFNERLKSVEFEPASKLRSIGREAFRGCKSLESISIPPSVEVLRVGCFLFCSALQAVTFGAGSQLRIIEKDLFDPNALLKLVSVPASAKVVLPTDGC
jgi:hypothetical protein